MNTACVICLSLFFVGSGALSKVPHIVHIVADDLGWADVGFRDNQVISPTIDTLAHEGVILDRFYVFKECAPSRGSIMTGRFPNNFGYYTNPTDLGNVPLNFTLLPELLRSGGNYATHAIGKWHLGFHTDSCTPTYRGFDSFFGYYHAFEDYYTHAFPGNPKKVGPHKCYGFDLNNNHNTTITEVGPEHNGTYSAFMYTKHAQNVINAHNPDQPLYLYLAYQNCHGPLEAPQRFINMYPHIKEKSRRTYCGMISALDEGVKNVTDTLKAAGLWDNTFLIFQTDNGGPLGAARNWPLRGGKFTLWEGGLKGTAFLGGPLIPPKAQGTVFHGLLHESDWYPTLLHLANINIPSNTGPMPIDGFNVWDSIANHSAHSPRKMILHQANNQWNNASECRRPALKQKHSCGGAFLFGEYKIVYGYAGDDTFGPDPTLLAEIPDTLKTTTDWWYDYHGGMAGDDVPPPANAPCVKKPCMFNVIKDPEEKHDLSGEDPARFHSLLKKFAAASEAAYPGIPGVPPNYPGPAECTVVNRTGSWQPWQKDEN